MLLSPSKVCIVFDKKYKLLYTIRLYLFDHFYFYLNFTFFKKKMDWPKGKKHHKWSHTEKPLGSIQNYIIIKEENKE